MGHLGDNCVPVSTRLGRDFVCAALVGWATLGQRHYLTALFSGWCCPPTADNGCVVRPAERSPQKLCSPPLLPPYSQGVPWAWVRVATFCASNTEPHAQSHAHVVTGLLTGAAARHSSCTLQSLRQPERSRPDMQASPSSDTWYRGITAALRVGLGHRN